MSQLHPTEEDDAFSAGHTEAGLRKSWRRIERLEDLLKKIRDLGLPADHELQAEVDLVLSCSSYDEEDNGDWRFTSTRKQSGPLPPLKKRS